MNVQDPADPDLLLQRWNALVPRAGDLGQDLLARYSEPARHYHDLRHLAEVLDRIDALASYAHDPDVVRLAGWFHDAVYDSHRGDNEDASARMAAQVLPPRGLTQDRVEEVARLVRLTASHDPDPGDPDGQVLCDADLAILAAGPERYGEYAAGVRAEYAHVDDDAFRRGRAAVLDALLGHDQLFHTLQGQAWEQRARHNLAAEIVLLRG